ncbi:MAG TPA: response regulator transcription factor [Solirubrobacteraceae bacterium]|jgi:DNA-binding response OmpR family regulator|nr:response regulator transcription factor [Solirubrobacteraceae bacterium]
MMCPTRIEQVLVVEDDDAVRAAVCAVFERAGVRVSQAADGRSALRKLYEQRPRLVVLDLGLPELDGHATLDRIRDVSDVPVLVLTGADGEVEKVRLLRAGADDYVTKPFGRQELLARAEALVRRAGELEVAEEVYDDGCVRIDVKARGAWVDGEPISLTAQEFRLLLAFVRHPNNVLSYIQLLDLAWGDMHGGTRDQVKVYVGYLRRRLGAARHRIETVRGFGYRYTPCRNAS